MDDRDREFDTSSNLAVSENPPAFVFGVGCNGLSFVRSLGRRGIAVVGVDLWMRPGLRSRYCHPLLVPSPETDEGKLLGLLKEHARTLARPGVLLSTTDAFTLFLSKHADKLGEWYDFNLPEYETVATLTNKRLQYEYALRQGVAIPRTIYPGDMPVESAARELEYPCIIKPCVSHEWRRYLTVHGLHQWGKVVEARSPKELIERYHDMERSGLEFLLQEKVGGGDDRLCGLLTYLDRSSRPLGVFTKQKLRQYPRDYGDGSLQISVRAPDVEELGLRLLRSLNYHGLAGVEFKRDPVDGKLKLIEVNPRSISQTHHAVACGVDIPYIAYQDSRGEPVPETPPFREGVKWLSFEREARAFLEHWKAGDLNLLSWLRSWEGDRCYAYLSKDDPLPAVVATTAFIRDQFPRPRGPPIRDATPA